MGTGIEAGEHAEDGAEDMGERQDRHRRLAEHGAGTEGAVMGAAEDGPMAEDDALGGSGGSAGEEDRRPVRRGCRDRIGRGVRHIVHRENRDGKALGLFRQGAACDHGD